MGKIRVKTIGDDNAEKKQKEEARKRKEARKVEASEEQRGEDPGAESRRTPPVTQGEPEPSDAGKSESKDTAAIPEQKTEEPKKSKYATKQSASRRSEKYKNAQSQIDKAKLYTLKEALTILPKIKLSSFDETVELHVNTIETGVSGSLTLPHGTGKTVRIAIANQTTDPAGVDELVKTIESGKITFDVLIATPDAMPKLARVAKFLGPRGLMPNPKAGTVTPKPEDVAKKFESGQINFKTEAKFPIIHVAVGKLSFGDDKLTENIKAVLAGIQTKRVKNVTLKSTMSPGIKLNTASL